MLADHALIYVFILAFACAKLCFIGVAVWRDLDHSADDMMADILTLEHETSILRDAVGQQPKGKVKGPPPAPKPAPVRFNICPYCLTEYGKYGHCENCGAPVRNRQTRQLPPPGPPNELYMHSYGADDYDELRGDDGVIARVHHRSGSQAIETMPGIGGSHKR